MSVPVSAGGRQHQLLARFPSADKPQSYQAGFNPIAARAVDADEKRVGAQCSQKRELIVRHCHRDVG